MLPEIHDDVPNWWYHYYSRGTDEKIRILHPRHFLLSKKKYTPDFTNYMYDFGICHPQIGESVIEEKSIVLLKTTVGTSNPGHIYLPKMPYLVGYYRVKKIDRENGLIHIDKDDSFLLFDAPILLNKELVTEMFIDKPEGYWSDENNVCRLLGSTLRNKKATRNELSIALRKINEKIENGSHNYFGLSYQQLLDGS